MESSASEMRSLPFDLDRRNSTASMRSSAALTCPVDSFRKRRLRGDDASDVELEDYPGCSRGDRAVVLRQPEGDGLAVAARHGTCACSNAIAATPIGLAQLDRRGPGRDLAVGN